MAELRPANNGRRLATQPSQNEVNFPRRTNACKAGNQLRQLGGRSAKAAANFQATHVDKRYETGISLPGSQSQRNQLLTLPAGNIVLNHHRTLTFSALNTDARDRLAITGCNGAGKTMLLALGMLRAPHLIIMDEPTNHLGLGR
jgi:ATPase subunit of ABC transporter with duplicated ATPase domains